MSEPSNPANSPKQVSRTRIPMSSPQQKLSVPDIPGFHLHWMLGGAARISQALAGGYEFVDPSEVDLGTRGIADNASAEGSTDLGSRVSVSAGSGLGEDGAPERLYLMKIKQEWWTADQLALEDRNEQIAATLRGGRTVGGDPSGSDHNYIPDAHKKSVADLFTRKSRRI